MTHPHWLWWANALQLAFAGVAATLCVYQTSVWRGEGRLGSARLLAATAGLVAALLVTNAGLLETLGGPRTNLLLVVRSLLLSALALAVLLLAVSLSEGRPLPPWLTGAVVLVVGARVVLWLGTHLDYTYRLAGGVPHYGPLEEPNSLILLGLLVACVAWVAASKCTGQERAVVLAGLAGGLCVDGVAVVQASGLVSELLTGFLALPFLAALIATSWMRQRREHAELVRFAARQRALADLSRLALVRPVEDLGAAVDAALAEHLPASPDRRRRREPRTGDRSPTASVEPHYQEFVAAATNVLRAASDRERVVAELDHLASHDDLTGLPNRARVRSMVAAALAEVRPGSPAGAAVAFCNLDRFKTVNDAYGHTAGDEFLRAVATRLHESLRPCDEVGRFGSDEFVVVCSGIGRGDTAEALVDRIHRALHRPVVTETTQARLAITIGVATAPPGEVAVDGDSLLRDAVTAMHDAKARRAHTGSFSDEMRAAALWRADVEGRLSQALHRDQIVVHYQPVVELGGGRVVGFEALARWRDGANLVPPTDWIPIAESTDLIQEIGAHILVVAAEQAGAWQRAGHAIGVNVNVSARQLGHQELERAVDTAVGLVPRESLCLELTESLALGDEARAAVDALSCVGVRFALDDFGTGYSSLAVIAQLPVQQIKIDRSITSRVGRPGGGALFEATLAIARSFGLTVVAEGVETMAQHRALLALSCHRAQGFLYSAPLDAAAATELLRRGEAIGAPGSLRRH